MNVSKKTFLITGGAGFIGSHTARALIERGARVIIVDNLSTGRKENLPQNAVFHNLNIANPSLEDVFRQNRIDGIYHFAFNVLVPQSVENPLMDMESIAGVLNVLMNARAYGVQKLVFSSSGFVYGNATNLPVREEEPTKPSSPYAIAKCAAENYIRFFRSAFKVPSVILRYAAVYGPGQITGAMTDYIAKLAQGQQAQMWGDGTKTRDYVYIDDVIQANLLALDVPVDHSDPTFNVGTSKETSLNALYKSIAKLLEKTPSPLYLPDRPGEQIRYCLDCAKIKKELGWTPQYTLARGLEQRLREEGFLA